MPEEGLETQELKEKLEEIAEGAEGGSRAWTLWLSLSTAILAVLAAIASLESGSLANEALIDKNDAVLHQSKADDEWARYQAMGVKAVLYATQAAGVTDPELAKKWSAEAERERTEQKEIRAKAEGEETTRERMSEESSHSLHLHHQFAKSVTIFQVSIALSAIAALTRRKAMWWLSLFLGGGGVVFFVLGFVHG
jgi:hypothetical protein